MLSNATALYIFVIGKGTLHSGKQYPRTRLATQFTSVSLSRTEAHPYHAKPTRLFLHPLFDCTWNNNKNLNNQNKTVCNNTEGGFDTKLQSKLQQVGVVPKPADIQSVQLSI